MTDWLNRPAIIWDHNDAQVNDCYWNRDSLILLAEREGSHSVVSYKKLISTASLLVTELRAQLAKIVPNRQENESIGIPIAVAIPEGPLLPLAVLTVHALNEPSSLGSTSTCHAILVPVEPSEAKERNLHILNDVLPLKILAVPGKDMGRLQEIMESITYRAAPGEVSSEGLYLPESSELVDFLTLVQNVLQKSKLKHSHLQDLETILEKDDTTSRLSIQSLVTMCADFLSNDADDENIDLYVPEKQGANNENPRSSHIVYTSGTTGRPKGCVSSIMSLQHYLRVKNEVYSMSQVSTVLLASALSFDPCLSDILATFHAKATLAIAPRASLLGKLSIILQTLRVTHLLCTPTLFGLLAGSEPNEFPFLQIVALGGEPIPKRLRQKWARRRGSIIEKPEDRQNSTCRLFATYGVTEACVYQTCGEVFSQDSVGERGQYVGQPFQGIGIRICNEKAQDMLVDAPCGESGEVVLYGSQLDKLSGYLNRPELSYKFVCEASLETTMMPYHYRTGDRGKINEIDGSLMILGRIVGEEGMVKINGVRVELGEIESSLVDDLDDEQFSDPVVVNCLAVVIKKHNGSLMGRSEIHAYCVLSDSSLGELGISKKDDFPYPGILVCGGPLLALLRTRCVKKVKAACIPTAFVVIPCIPLSPTGKRDRSGLPGLNSCIPLDHGDQKARPLEEYGASGAIVSEFIVDCLNLQSSQESMVTTTVTFTMLGGDSLAATRVTRALYAHHYQVDNSRFLGGEYGKLDGPFDVLELLRAKNLGEYVDMLDKNKIATLPPGSEGTLGTPQSTEPSKVESALFIEEHSASDDENMEALLYDALLQAATLGQTTIGVGLLKVGTDPNCGAHGHRLGKVSHRMEQKELFRSSPLHLACSKGDIVFVKELLKKNSKINAPDASGLYPLHLASSGWTDGDEESNADEDSRRLQCVKMLLEAGSPMAMRDHNKQTVLHAAARAGHWQLLKHFMLEWRKQNGEEGPIPAGHFFNWRDRWMRKCCQS